MDITSQPVATSCGSMHSWHHMAASALARRCCKTSSGTFVRKVGHEILRRPGQYATFVRLFTSLAFLFVLLVTFLLTYLINWISLSGNSQKHERHKQHKESDFFLFYLGILCLILMRHVLVFTAALNKSNIHLVIEAAAEIRCDIVKWKQHACVMATYNEAIICDYNKMLLCTVTEHVKTGLF